MIENKKKPILDVQNLKTHFYTEEGIVKAVDGVDFQVYSGEILGLVGESGCGKSVTSLSVMRLIDKPGKIVNGKIYFSEKNLLELKESEMVKMRGNQISMIYQQPQSCLNPIYKVGDQIAEVLNIHSGLSKAEAWENSVELLNIVGIPDARKKAKAYPHEMSGGQAQRVMIAMALALQPKLLIADEPTTALDVTIQAQILDLILGLREQFGTAVILITHDLGVIAEMADRVAVMYAGQIVEEADVKTLVKKPLHPYSQGLISSIPILGKLKDRLTTIPGSVPNLVNLPEGCRFAERCQLRKAHKLEICKQEVPPLARADGNHSVRCWMYIDTEDHSAPLNLDI
ncbi:MAG: ABC transporter ATP-binding protein [Anaerolineaceae bacterium]|nr:ABC transporter ATP-binding protein [Anaerolineaceae bacterium]